MKKESLRLKWQFLDFNAIIWAPYPIYYTHTIYIQITNMLNP